MQGNCVAVAIIEETAPDRGAWKRQRRLVYSNATVGNDSSGNRPPVKKIGIPLRRDLKVDLDVGGRIRGDHHGEDRC